MQFPPLGQQFHFKGACHLRGNHPEFFNPEGFQRFQLFFIVRIRVLFHHALKLVVAYDLGPFQKKAGEHNNRHDHDGITVHGVGSQAGNLENETPVYGNGHARKNQSNRKGFSGKDRDAPWMRSLRKG